MTQLSELTFDASSCTRQLASAAYSTAAAIAAVKAELDETSAQLRRGMNAQHPR